MISVRIFYLLLLIGIFIFYIMYAESISFIMLLFVVLMPIITYILFFLSRKKLDISLKSAGNSISKDDEITLNLIVENKGFIPVSKVLVKIAYKNDLLGAWDKFTVSTFARANNTQRLSCVIKSQFSGSVTAKIEKIEVYDLLLLFKKKTKSSKLVASSTSVNSIVFPNISEVALDVNSANTVDYESDIMSKTQKGDDPSEIFDIHEYAPGDKLNRIHWKLSAKSEETYVKDFSLPITNNTCLLFNPMLKNTNDRLNALRLIDIALEAIFSVSFALCEKEVIHNLVYFDGITKEFEKKTITDFDECRMGISELLKIGSDFLESVINSYIGSEYDSRKKTVYFTSSISKEEIDFIADSDINNLTVICSDEIDYNCYPVPENINLIIIKNGDISKSIEQLRI